MTRETGGPTEQGSEEQVSVMSTPLTGPQSVGKERSRAGLIGLIVIYTAGRLLIVAVLAAVLLAVRSVLDLQVPIAVLILAAIGLGSVGSFVALRTMRGRLRDEIDYWEKRRRTQQRVSVRRK